MNSDRRYMVDGQWLREEEVRQTFDNGRFDPKKLDHRQTIALDMIAHVIGSGRYADIGCYTGTFLNAVLQTCPGVDAIGVDYFEDHVAMAKLLYPMQKGKFFQMNVYELDFQDEAMDCVSCLEVLEHLDRPVDAIREMNRVLKPGGYLVLSTPNANADAWRLLFAGIKAALKRFLGRGTIGPGHCIYFANVEWNRHIYNWTPVELNTLLMLNGFDCVSCQFSTDRLMQRVFPAMGGVQVFLARKARRAPVNII